MRKAVQLEYEMNYLCPRFQPSMDDHVKDEVRANAPLV